MAGEHIGGTLGHEQEFFGASRDWTQKAPDAFPKGDSTDPNQVITKKKDRMLKKRNRKKAMR